MAYIPPIIGTVDTNNSTTTPLGSNGVFTGTATDVTKYASIVLYVYSNQSSATGGVYIEFSSDGTNWEDASPFTFIAGGSAPNAGQTFVASRRGQYMRVVYTNGASAQATFRLQTILNPNNVGADTLPISATINQNDHGLLTLSQIVGLSTGGGGTYVPVKVAPSGALTTADDIKTLDGTTVAVNNGTANNGTLRVTIASDSTGTVAATQSGTWNINNVSGTVSLPTGASTLAEQQTQTTSLQLIDDTVYTDGTGTVSKGIAVFGQDGTNPQAIKTDSNGELQIDVLTLPSNASVNVSQLAGTTTSVNSGSKDNGTLRVVIATDQPQLTNALKVDGSAVTQPISGSVTNTPTVPSTIYNGKTTVTTAGTRVVLAASQAVRSVVIKALSANTGFIYVGDSTVASTNGFALSAGDTVSLEIANLNTVNIDSSVNGEGVTYIATN